jgi:hypothetical protein
VTAGCTALRTRLQGSQRGLIGTDLVRLGLERAASARQAVDLITDLIGRYGQGVYAGCSPEDRHDAALLIADRREAFAIEASGSYWVYQEIQQVRAMSDVSTVHQDWDRIARGLAGYAIESCWWPGDGSKLDFAQAVGGGLAADTSALRRWGRATLLLEEQNGWIDLACVRRLLSDHYETAEDDVDLPADDTGPVPLCRHQGPRRTAASLIASLGEVPVAWHAMGPPCTSVYFPVLLDADLPPALGPAGPARGGWVAARLRQLHDQIGSDEAQGDAVRATFALLQARLDADLEEFLAESAHHFTHGDREEFGRLAGLFMEHTVERFEAVLESLPSSASPPLVVQDWKAAAQPRS